MNFKHGIWRLCAVKRCQYPIIKDLNGIGLLQKDNTPLHGLMSMKKLQLICYAC